MQFRMASTFWTWIWTRRGATERRSPSSLPIAAGPSVRSAAAARRRVSPTSGDVIEGPPPVRVAIPLCGRPRCGTRRAARWVRPMSSAGGSPGTG
jgi:hypothetical protein